MLTAEAASFAVTLASSVIKLTRRIDLVRAEKAAVEGPLGVAPPAVAQPPTYKQTETYLKNFLRRKLNPPLDLSVRTEIENAIAAASVDENRDMLLPLMERHIPAESLGRTLDLDETFVRELRKRYPDIAQDRDLLIAAFCMSSGPDVRTKNYTWRTALTVVDAVAEFGAESTALFTRDEDLRKVISSVLIRFGEANVQLGDSTGDLLRTAVSSTLNGALDARGAYDPDSKWLSGILDALTQARDAMPEERRSNFLLGLLSSQGYPTLVAATLRVSAGRLSDEDSDRFGKVAGDFLSKVAGLVDEKKARGPFFEGNWADILGAGLESVQKHGPALLAGEDPLLTKVLVSVVGELAASTKNQKLDRDTVSVLVRAATAAVAANPDLVADVIEEKWLRELIASVTSTLAETQLRGTFTQAGVADLIQAALSRFAERPELIIERPGLAQELVRGVLKSTSVVDTLAAESLATAAVTGALESLGSNPGLLRFEYPKLLASLANTVAQQVKDGNLTQIEGSDLLLLVTDAIAENPAVFLEAQSTLAREVVDAIVGKVGEDEVGLIVRGALVETVRQVLAALAKSGRAALVNHPQADVAEQVAEVVIAGLTRAEKELGNRIGLSTVPAVVGDLVELWAHGKIATVDPDNGDFRRTFSELVEDAAA